VFRSDVISIFTVSCSSWYNAPTVNDSWHLSCFM